MTECVVGKRDMVRHVQGLLRFQISGGQDQIQHVPPAQLLIDMISEVQLLVGNGDEIAEMVSGYRRCLHEL